MVDLVVDDSWLAVAATLCSAARGNDRFVTVRPLGRLLSAWSTARTLSPTTMTAPTLDVHTGLPHRSVWSDLMGEHRIGAALPPSSMAATPVDLEGDHARARLHRREAAARTLAKAPPLTLVEGRVDVRRVDHDSVTVAVILDRVVSGLLVRVSADVVLPPGSAARGSSGIRVDDDRAHVAAPLLDLLGRCVHLPAPAIAVQLAALGDVRLLRLSRGVVGPMSVNGQGSALAGYSVDNGAVLALSMEELAEAGGAEGGDHDNDVFATDDLRQLQKAMPSALAHLRVVRDARVVATATAAALVRDAARRRDLQTVITVV